MSKKLLVFLGGTCNESQWRERLMAKLNPNIEAFNPVVAEWNEEAKARELDYREKADYVVYMITPLMLGVYSVAEATDDSNKRPANTIFVVSESDVTSRGDSVFFEKHQLKSLIATGELIERNGGTYLRSEQELLIYLNLLQYAI